jgi:hypothetical protein
MVCGIPLLWLYNIIIQHTKSLRLRAAVRGSAGSPRMIKYNIISCSKVNCCVKCLIPLTTAGVSTAPQRATM